MNKLKELFSDSVVYGLSSVVARFINYLLVPFYTKFFDPAEYGVVGLIYAAIVFLNVIYTFGMESAYIRYASDNKWKKEKVFVTLQLALFGVATALGAFLYFGAGSLIMPLMSLEGSAGQQLFVMMLAILWLDALSIVPYAHLRIVRKAWLYAIIKLVNVIINVALNLYLVIGLGWGLEAILISNIIASGVSLLMLIVVTLPMYKVAPELAILKTALVFGLPYVPNGIGFAINEVLDRFFLNQMNPDTILAIYGTPYTPEEITGIYNACYKLAIFMLLLVQMFRLAWQPFFMRYAKDDASPKLFAQVFFYFNLVSAAVFMGVGIFVEHIVAIPVPFLDGTIIDSRFWSGLSIVPILLMAYWFQGWFINFSSGIFIREKTIRFPLITFFGALFTIIGNIVLVPILGMTGSAIATLACYAAMSILTLYYANQVFPVKYPLLSVILMMVFGSLIVWIGFTLPFIVVSEVITRIVLFFIGLAVLLVLWFFAAPDRMN